MIIIKEIGSIRKLDELRIKRNSIGHFFARKKEEYEITYSPEVAPPIQVSASKLKEYFNLINTAVVQIDQHLHVNFIGSYDVLKYFYFHMRKNDLVNENPSILARELRKQIKIELDKNDISIPYNQLVIHNG